MLEGGAVDDIHAHLAVGPGGLLSEDSCVCLWLVFFFFFFFFTSSHFGMTGESRGFSQGAEGFSSYDGEFRLPLVLAQGSPIFHSSFEGELGFALESLQGKRDLI